MIAYIEISVSHKRIDGVKQRSFWLESYESLSEKYQKSFFFFFFVVEFISLNNELNPKLELAMFQF